MGVGTCKTWAVYANSSLKQADFKYHPLLLIYFIVPFLSLTSFELLLFAFGSEN